MQYGYLACICAVVFAWDVSLAEGGDARPGETPPGERLGDLLQQASETPESPYFLKVNCTDRKGIRSIELFPGGVTIWNRHSQIMLPPVARTTLLMRLVEAGFAGFEERYGGVEQPAKSSAPARITCSIQVEIQNLEKTTLQMAGGKQSAPLLDLAAKLLDGVEQYVDSAVTPVDLQDGLDKLGNGLLAPQVLRLRFMELPARDSDNPGFILRISGAKVSYQAYSPGQSQVAPTLKTLERGQFTRLISALQKEQLASLPTNLWSENQVELEVQVLAHKKVVLARQFSRLASTGQVPAQQRFDALLGVLKELTH